MQSLRRRLAAVSAENAALKSELEAFDPQFWEELEDLKYDRHQLAARVDRYAATIRSLSAQLNIMPALE
jgi:hypothetical protein